MRQPDETRRLFMSPARNGVDFEPYAVTVGPGLDLPDPSFDHDRAGFRLNDGRGDQPGPHGAGGEAGNRAKRNQGRKRQELKPPVQACHQPGRSDRTRGGAEGGQIGFSRPHEVCNGPCAKAKCEHERA